MLLNDNHHIRRNKPPTPKPIMEVISPAVALPELKYFEGALLYIYFAFIEKISPNMANNTPPNQNRANEQIPIIIPKSE